MTLFFFDLVIIEEEDGIYHSIDENHIITSTKIPLSSLASSFTRHFQESFRRPLLLDKQLPQTDDLLIENKGVLKKFIFPTRFALMEQNRYQLNNNNLENITASGRSLPENILFKAENKLASKSTCGGVSDGLQNRALVAEEQKEITPEICCSVELHRQRLLKPEEYDHPPLKLFCFSYTNKSLPLQACWKYEKEIDVNIIEFHSLEEFRQFFDDFNPHVVIVREFTELHEFCKDFQEFNFAKKGRSEIVLDKVYQHCRAFGRWILDLKQYLIMTNTGTCFLNEQKLLPIKTMEIFEKLNVLTHIQTFLKVVGGSINIFQSGGYKSCLACYKLFKQRTLSSSGHEDEVKFWFSFFFSKEIMESTKTAYSLMTVSDEDTLSRKRLKTMEENQVEKKNSCEDFVENLMITCSTKADAHVRFQVFLQEATDNAAILQLAWECKRRGRKASNFFVSYLLQQKYPEDELKSLSTESNLFHQALLKRKFQEDSISDLRKKEIILESLRNNSTEWSYHPALKNSFFEFCLSNTVTKSHEFFKECIASLTEPEMKMLILMLFSSTIKPQPQQIRGSLLAGVGSNWLLRNVNKTITANSFEYLIKEDIAKGRLFLETLLQEEEEEDAFELTTPTRHRARVESWRRLGEKIRKRRRNVSNEEKLVREGIQLSSIWISALLGQIPINTTAAAIGIIYERKSALSEQALEISTQMDEENLLPSAFLTSLFLKRTMNNMNEMTCFAYCCEQTNACNQKVLERVPTVMEQHQKNERLFPGNLPSALFFQLVVQLFHDHPQDSLLARTILIRIARLSASSSCPSEEQISCFWVQEISNKKTNALLVGEDSAKVLPEETLALAHLRLNISKGDSCPDCSGFFPFECFWRIHQNCTQSSTSLNYLAQCLEMQNSSISKFDTPAVGARLQILAKEVSLELVQEKGTKRINGLLRVLGGISFSSSIGRCAVIEHLPWDSLLRLISNEEDGFIRTNCFVLIHEICTKVTKPGTSTTTLSFNNSFLSKKDYMLLIEAEERYNLVQHLLHEGIATKSQEHFIKVLTFSIESVVSLLELSKAKKFPMKESNFARELFGFMKRILVFSKAIQQHPQTRSTLSKLINMAIQTCPLLHFIQNTTTMKDQQQSIGVRLFCNLLDDSIVAEKLLMAIKQQ